jgi:hypothetical protein
MIESQKSHKFPAYGWQTRLRRTGLLNDILELMGYDNLIFPFTTNKKQLSRPPSRDLSALCNDLANSKQTPGQARGLRHFSGFAAGCSLANKQYHRTIIFITRETRAIELELSAMILQIAGRPRVKPGDYGFLVVLQWQYFSQ